MTPFPAPRSSDDFQVAIVCALTSELDAIFLTLDELWDSAAFHRTGDSNNYVTGRIGRLNVVLAKSTRMGTLEMAHLTGELMSSYPKIRLIAVVGVCAGVATAQNGMVLGDVVVSDEVVQYDFGRQYADGLDPKKGVADSLGPLHKSIRSHVQGVKSRHQMLSLLRHAEEVMGQIREKAAAEESPFDYAGPTASEDRLFEAGYLHMHRDTDGAALACGCDDAEASSCDDARGSSCDELKCDLTRVVRRDRLDKADTKQEQPSALSSPTAELKVFVGCVGSGDSVLKSSKHRDEIVRKHPGILAFEMEGAGAWDRGACVVIKGVCDYADSHKNGQWQDFAAARAASVTKALLARLPLSQEQDSSRTRRPPRARSRSSNEGEERERKRRRAGGRDGVLSGATVNSTNSVMGTFNGGTFNFGNASASKSTQDNVNSM